ncbi:MAG TPA: phosphate signaling complex protein PhoU [Spirochaetia bacterium]|nr:phosphate signaling complex protein PhoU [Spirochaetia bacterium]
MPIAQIEDLSARVVAYARHVEDMISQCRASIVAWSPQALNNVVEKAEPRANEFEVELEEECTSLIAQHQPMAKELRTILMVRSMTNDLERMADHAVNIAEAALACDGLSTTRPDGDLLRLFDETISMVDRAVRSFIAADAELGQEVCEADALVDQLAAEMLERISASMIGDNFTIEQSLCILKIAGNLERIADLSTNIGEDVIYMTEGRVIKHHMSEER